MSGHDCGAIESCCAHIPFNEGDCRHCLGGTPGVIELPAELYDPAEIPCPWCQPQAYPDGFPGLIAQPADIHGHWLIEPMPQAAEGTTT